MNKPSVATLAILTFAALDPKPSLKDLYEDRRERDFNYENPRGRYPGPGARVPGHFKKRVRASR